MRPTTIHTIDRIVLVFAIIAALIIGWSIAEANAATDWRQSECRYRNYAGGPRFNREEILLTISCGVDHWSVPGGYDKAVAVAMCESGLGPNAGTTYIGLYQFHPDTFDGVYQRFRPTWQRWEVKDNPWNARSNALLALRKAHADGWSAWGCA